MRKMLFMSLVVSLVVYSSMGAMGQNWLAVADHCSRRSAFLSDANSNEKERFFPVELMCPKADQRVVSIFERNKTGTTLVYSSLYNNEGTPIAVEVATAKAGSPIEVSYRIIMKPTSDDEDLQKGCKLLNDKLNYLYFTLCLNETRFGSSAIARFETVLDVNTIDLIASGVSDVDVEFGSYAPFSN